MEVVFLPKADEDLAHWVNSGNKLAVKRIVRLTEAILSNPYSGIGKPEALRYQLVG